jgi:hypothetical protein
MKTHLRANQGNGGQKYFTACAARSMGGGKVNRNNRQVYQNIPQCHIVGIPEFREIPEEERCSHCMGRGLIMRNGQRRRNGLPPVSHLFEKSE